MECVVTEQISAVWLWVSISLSVGACVMATLAIASHKKTIAYKNRVHEINGYLETYVGKLRILGPTGYPETVRLADAVTGLANYMGVEFIHVEGTQPTTIVGAKK